MTPQNIAMIIIIPVSLMGVIGLVLLSGLLSPMRRRAIERGLVLIFYPVAFLYWTVRSVMALFEQDWIWVAGAACLGAIMAVQGFKLIRKPAPADGTRT